MSTSKGDAPLNVVELLVKAYKALVAQSEATSHKEVLAAVKLGESVIDEVEDYFQLVKPAPISLAKLYGCHNREELADAALVQSGWTPGNTRNMVTIPVTMAKKCQYTITPLGLNDVRCTDCKHKREV